MRAIDRHRATLILLLQATVAFLFGTQAAALPMAIPFVLFIPGYVLFGARAPGDQAFAIAFSIATSLSLCVVGGLALNAIGMFNKLGWLVWTGSLILLGVAFYPEKSGDPSKREGAVSASSGGTSWPRRDAMLFAAGAAIVGLSYLIAVVGEKVADKHEFVELWAALRSPAAVEIGLSNREVKAGSYEVLLFFNGLPVARWKTEDLEPGKSATWVWSPDAPGKVEAKAFRLPDRSTVIRQVSLNVHVP